ncbi:MAG: hypothetical protein Q9160_006059 [Pyrenula sp. 1 TL-2023]
MNIDSSIPIPSSILKENLSYALKTYDSEFYIDREPALGLYYESDDFSEDERRKRSTNVRIASPNGETTTRKRARSKANDGTSLVPSYRSKNQEHLIEELDNLRLENERLRAEISTSSVPLAAFGHTYKTLYIFDRGTYLNEPHGEPGDRAVSLRASNPLRNTDYYLDQHPEIAFVFYKTYESRPPADLSKIQTKDGVFKDPKPDKETLFLRASEILEAVEEFVERVPKFKDYFPHFDPYADIKAPYLFMYYSQPFVIIVLTELDDKHRGLMQKLYQAIIENYGWEYEAAKRQAKKGIVSRNLFKYLIQPLEVLVSPQGNNTEAYLTLDWVEEQPIEFSDTDEQYEEYD